jgi:hypothetical protein
MMRSRGVGVTTTALSGPIDVHMATHERAHQGGRRLPPASGLTVGRRIGGFAVAAAPPAPPASATVGEDLTAHPAVTSCVEAWRAASRRGAAP